MFCSFGAKNESFGQVGSNDDENSIKFRTIDDIERLENKQLGIILCEIKGAAPSDAGQKKIYDQVKAFKEDQLRLQNDLKNYMDEWKLHFSNSMFSDPPSKQQVARETKRLSVALGPEAVEEYNNWFGLDPAYQYSNVGFSRVLDFGFWDHSYEKLNNQRERLRKNREALFAKYPKAIDVAIEDYCNSVKNDESAPLWASGFLNTYEMLLQFYFDQKAEIKQLNSKSVLTGAISPNDPRKKKDWPIEAPTIEFEPKTGRLSPQSISVKWPLGKNVLPRVAWEHQISFVGESKKVENDHWVGQGIVISKSETTGNYFDTGKTDKKENDPKEFKWEIKRNPDDGYLELFLPGVVYRLK